jgi:leucyl aminopeptidase
MSSFPSWTFDTPCRTMQWNAITTKLVAGGNSIDDADLVVMGLFSPEKEDSNSSSSSHLLLFPEGGWVQRIDQGMGHALQDLWYEQDAKVMSQVGATTAVLRAFVQNSAGGGNSSSIAQQKEQQKVQRKKRYVLLSLGKSWTTAPANGIGWTIGKAMATVCTNEKKVITAGVHLPDTIVSNPILLRDIAVSFYSELYRDNRYRTGDTIQQVDCTMVSIRCEDSTVRQDVLDHGYCIANGIILAKDIVNAPHNVLNSVSLAETAQRIAQTSIHGRIKCTILGAKECEALGMGAYLGVARGSETPPQFIHLTYTPPNVKNDLKRIGIVGKGLLFDTGGYNIKTQMMEVMKFDCGGAAALLGAARVLGTMQEQFLPNVQVHFIVAACENMINDKAMVPSDVLIASNGLTIEVMNTDAEGRLTLADALVYADKECKCESIIELSTLTGSCMVALGKEICGIWTHHDELADELLSISKVTGDKSWRMPMAKEYNEQLKSKCADLQNIGTRFGGSITAALFLQNFVDETKPFAHIDIAGPVWDDKIGATGFGTKLVLEWITRQGK